MTAPTRILTNGKIWCGLAEGFAEALAISGDKVLATGTADDIAALAGPDTDVIDLEGRLAVPGLNDAHLHLHMYGKSLVELDMRPEAGITSVQAFVDRVAEAVKNAKPGQWILGRGFDHDKLDERRFPTRHELDAVSPDNPVYLSRTCGHSAVANTVTLRAADIGHNTPDPFGGKIERVAGDLTGVLYENARAPVMAILPPLSEEELVDAIERGGKSLLSYGITSCMEAAIGLQVGTVELDAYLTARKANRIPVRVAGTLMGDLERNVLDYAYQKGLVTGVGDDIFRIGPVKYFTDGSAGAGTAWMSKAYENDPTNFGVQCLTQEQTDALTMIAHERGYQLAPHAIGDAAIDMVLNAYEKAYAASPAPDRRHRIEHCGWHKPEDLPRMIEMGVIPAGQPSFLYFFGEGYHTILGDERPQHCYPFKTWLDSGLHPSASTDCPVTSPDPLPCLYALVARRSDSGKPLGLDQALTMAEALHLYTYEAAYGVHDEERKGRLIPGQLADVAVFDTDFFTVPHKDILKARCLMTMLGGEVVYRAEAA
ncbi:hypothetical protein SAMN05421774_102615 [Gemmobacter megaterium]|uniref:Amidohydrolase 3 domain-containing protein n=1 Tax=Gemmobacter megaterium TaxID=1086013 RepID=A0A1N7MDI3_9RHOB|nr:amidohydrolase [Gemmobacter megaterium]GGE07311.1 amidohydrolase [Gemmobacter megaterium]SIS84225.1 hypothetical protein SAMN05421774_102615 [Gemmobacter megaterium]